MRVEPGLLPTALLALLTHAGCPGSGPVSLCPEAPGCPDVCCDDAHLCKQQVCDGVAYTCQGGEAEGYGWVKGPLPSCRPDSGPPDADVDAAGVDAVARDAVGDMGTDRGPADEGGPDPDLCLCAPGATRPCGHCNQGTQTCAPGCTAWGSCENQPCKPGAKETCPNDCGDRTCSASCRWGDCSKAGQLVKPSGKGCWSPNHCPPGSPGGAGRCVDCWLGCEKDGTAYEDAWCAGSTCQTCSPINNGCT